MKMDPYKTLNLQKEATQDEIRFAFRSMAKETHPDMNGGNEALTKKFREVAEAYAILSNPSKKALYDNLAKDDKNKEEEVFNASSSPFNVDYRVRIIEQYIQNLHFEVSGYKDEARNQLLKGLGWLGGGAAISFFTYIQAAQSGGTYVVFYGAIIFGGIQALIGLYNYMEINSHIQKVEKLLWEEIDSMT